MPRRSGAALKRQCDTAVLFAYSAAEDDRPVPRRPPLISGWLGLRVGIIRSVMAGLGSGRLL